MWEPIVKDNKLYGLSEDGRLVEVDEKEMLKLCDFESAKEVDKGITATYTWKKCTFTADESNGKLINIKVI